MTSHSQVSQNQIGGSRALPERMPPAVRYALLATVGALLSGALFLIAVRGEALLLDLQSVARFLCF